MRIAGLVLVLLLCAWESAAQAVVVRAGTGGFGGDLAFELSGRAQMRLGGTYVRWRPGRSTERFGVPTVSTGVASAGAFGITMDLFPGPDWFRVSAGLWAPATEARTTVVPEGSVSIDDGYISRAELGEVSVRVSVPNAIAPYLGVGLGNAAGGSRFAMLLDAGVYYHGTPEITLDASGKVAAMKGWEPVLAEAMQHIRFYPVVQLGMAVRW